MSKPWQRNAPAKAVGATPAPKAWAKKVRDPNKLSDLPMYDAYEPLPFDPWAQNDDGSVIPRAFRCIEAPDAGVRRTLRADDPDAWPDLT
jgi:hypothetical protein